MKTKVQNLSTKSVILMASLILSVGSFSTYSLVFADQFDTQINQLRAENNQKQSVVSALMDRADDLQGVIAGLQNQIDILQGQINESKAKSESLKVEIAKAEAELQRQRGLLGQNIRSMYLEGDISTLEMLASSKDISDFVDKQQYRNSVQDKIKTTLDKITELKLKLNAQKEEVEKLLDEQQLLQGKVASQRNEQQRLLNLNVSEQAALNQQIKDNKGRIAELQRQQVIENAKLFGGRIPTGVPGGGGYQYGDAVCLYPGYADPPCRQYDWGYPNASGSRKYFDQWQYGYRNCTSWVAFKLSQDGKRGFVGLGNARDWPENVPASWVTRGYGARVGDAAVRQSGTYGHVMYVEAVSGNNVIVSDYNAGGDGYYRIGATVSQSSLVFVHFPDN